MKKVYRLMPYEVSLLRETEQWLQEMAAQGLHFQSCALGVACFLRGEPMQLRYGLDFMRGAVSAPFEEQKILYEASGWEYVASIRRDYFVFRTGDAAAPPLRTDETLEKEELRWVCRAQRLYGVFLLALQLVIALRVADLYCGGSTALLQTLAMYGVWKPVLILLALGFFVWQIGRNFHLAHCLQTGRRVKRRRSLLVRPLYLGVLFTLLAVAVPVGGKSLFDANYVLPVEDIPFPTLREIDPAAEERLLAAESLQKSGYHPELDSSNYYSQRSDTFFTYATLWQELSQYSEEAVRQLEETGSSMMTAASYEGYFVAYYRCFSAAACARVCEEAAEKESRQCAQSWQSRTVEGLDEMRQMRLPESDEEVLLLRGDRQFVILRYCGEKTEEELAAAYAAMWGEEN